MMAHALALHFSVRPNICGGRLAQGILVHALDEVTIIVELAGTLCVIRARILIRRLTFLTLNTGNRIFHIDCVLVL